MSATSVPLFLALVLPLFQTGSASRLADFSLGIPSTWRSRSFVGETRYDRVQAGDGHWTLRATARNSASALGVRLFVNVRDRPIVRWRWKADRLPAGGDETKKRGDDMAARLLLVFNDSMRPSRLRTICYVWANTLRPGQTMSSPYSANVKIIAVESGSEAVGQWITEQRDYAIDYERLFGEPADRLHGVSIMTDSDNTHSVAVAYYDFIDLLAGPRD